MTGIVDADAHIDVGTDDLLPYIDEPWRRMIAASRPSNTFPQDVGDVFVGGRIRRPLPVPPRWPADPVGAAVRIVFPDPLIGEGLQPNPQIAVAVTFAYARWATEVFVPAHAEARLMLPLPAIDPDASRRLVAAFGDRSGVVGFFLGYANAPPRVQDERYVPVYAELEERGLSLAFQPTSIWRERPLDMFDRYLPVWAFGYPFQQCVHMVNWVFHGLPERFPRLRCIFYEAGIAWLGFIAHRMDQEFFKRPSEAPLLRERPSHYVARCYYSTHPVDQVSEPGHLEPVMRMVGCDRFLYGSNLPCWDFDTPEAIRRLTFLDGAEQAAICGGNAARLFGLDAAGAAREGA